jgi:hypothetical protein
MTTEASHASAHAIGELCVSGDWACAHGDFGALHHIARKLAGYVGEPSHCQLMALADACLDNAERAGQLWAEVKDQLYRSATP